MREGKIIPTLMIQRGRLGDFLPIVQGAMGFINSSNYNANLILPIVIETMSSIASEHWKVSISARSRVA